jgi:hypothetical protein
MSKILDFSLKPQECTQWCWAAVTTAIGIFFKDVNVPSEQCELVTQMVGGKDCCTECDCKNDLFDSCNQPVNLGVALARHGRDGSSGVARLSFEQVQNEIDKGRPIAVSVVLHEPAAPSHAIVIYGYQDDKNLNIADPMQAGSPISATLDELLNGTSKQLHGIWEAAFRTK